MSKHLTRRSFTTRKLLKVRTGRRVGRVERIVREGMERLKRNTIQRRLREEVVERLRRGGSR